MCVGKSGNSSDLHVRAREDEKTLLQPYFILIVRNEEIFAQQVLSEILNVRCVTIKMTADEMKTKVRGFSASADYI